MRTTSLTKTLSLLPILLIAGCREKGPGDTTGPAPGPGDSTAPWEEADGGYEEEFDRSYAPDGKGGGADGEMAMGMAGGAGGGGGDFDSAEAEPAMEAGGAARDDRTRPSAGVTSEPGAWRSKRCFAVF